MSMNFAKYAPVARVAALVIVSALSGAGAMHSASTPAAKPQEQLAVQKACAPAIVRCETPKPDPIKLELRCP